MMVDVRLLACAILAATAFQGCNARTAQPVDQNVAKEDAELDSLLNSMKQHPGLKEGEANPATGKPIHVPTTVPRKTSDSHAMQHDEHQPAPLPGNEH